MFDNFNVNLRKNEGFLTSIPCIPIPEYGQSNAPSMSRGSHWAIVASGKNTLDNDQCETVERAAKRQKIRERQSQYNEEMVKHTRQSRKAP